MLVNLNITFLDSNLAKTPKSVNEYVNMVFVSCDGNVGHMQFEHRTGSLFRLLTKDLEAYLHNPAKTAAENIPQAQPLVDTTMADA